MDRFEDEILTIIRTQLIIYIPVWIDLKTAVTENIDNFAFIYIPVWIDLKLYHRREIL